MSDKYGRRPLLVTSIAGTAISFFMAAWAPSAIFLFIARALDGLTAGNIPVAAAVISDSTEAKDRAKGFGIIGASFGFGFAVGPAISAFTIPYGIHVPFIIAGVISTIATILTWAFLPETNKHIGEVKKGKLFDFAKLFHMLFDPQVGRTLLISLVYSFTFGLFIFGFQPFAVKGMMLSANEISVIYTIFGIVGLISQIVLLPRVTKLFSDKRALEGSLLLASVAFLGLFFVTQLIPFVIISIMLGLANSFVNPLVQTILSKETDDKSQGSIQGLNASYISIGTIFGPIIGGALTRFSISTPFLLGAVGAIISFALSLHVMKLGKHKESAF